MADIFLMVAAFIQGVAVAYGIVLLSRRQGAAGAWLFLLGAMLSMLVWRVVVLTSVQPPAFFNPFIAIWGSTCMLAAMFLFGREVTRRRDAESERDALLASERAARSDAERASRLKDDFLATLSHELRTPLAAILGWCAVLRHARARREEADAAIETIERNARAQARLVDDLLDVTRMQAGSLQLDFATLALDVPVRAAMQSVLPAAEAKSITLRLECDDEPPLVKGDAGRLQQVAANLLVNAVKFTPPGGRITVTLGTVDGAARLVVADSGEGIDESFIGQLFTRFRQADSTTTRRHGGLGLGLSIAASLVRLHGGDVRAESEGRGKGARFTVRLPLAAGATRPAEESDEYAGKRALARTLAGLRILVVDDEPDVRSAVSRLLEQMGARVLALDSGRAIESILVDYRPHVLLCDIGMPDEDGYSLIRRVRKLPAPAGGATPAISLTAHAREEDRARALAAGFQHHLPKPIDVPVLAAAIRELASDASARKLVAGLG